MCKVAVWHQHDATARSVTILYCSIHFNCRFRVQQSRLETACVDSVAVLLVLRHPCDVQHLPVAHDVPHVQRVAVPLVVVGQHRSNHLHAGGRRRRTAPIHYRRWHVHVCTRIQWLSFSCRIIKCTRSGVGQLSSFSITGSVHVLQISSNFRKFLQKMSASHSAKSKTCLFSTIIFRPCSVIVIQIEKLLELYSYFWVLPILGVGSYSYSYSFGCGCARHLYISARHRTQVFLICTPRVRKVRLTCSWHQHPVLDSGGLTLSSAQYRDRA